MAQAARCTAQLKHEPDAQEGPPALKDQLDLEQHGGRSYEGVAIRVAQRVLAMAAGIWHDNQMGAPITHSLIAFDH